jgi:hypothetical protein
MEGLHMACPTPGFEKGTLRRKDSGSRKDVPMGFRLEEFGSSS